MPALAAFRSFRENLFQCDQLVADAHGMDSSGSFIFSALSREQITQAAFLNVFIAWETFLEEVMSAFMLGDVVSSGRVPTRYVTPVGDREAKLMLVGVNRFFDYGNHENVKKMVSSYFENGFPFEPHLTSITSELSETRTIRNACAHITHTTQNSLEALAQRIAARPWPNVNVYGLLISTDKRHSSAGTVFSFYRTLLEAAAELIVGG